MCTETTVYKHFSSADSIIKQEAGGKIQVKKWVPKVVLTASTARTGTQLPSVLKVWT